MKSKYTYGDIIKALSSFKIIPTDERINNLSTLHFQYPKLSLRMLIRRKTFYIEELIAVENTKSKKIGSITSFI